MKNPAIRSTLRFLQKIALIFLILLGIHMLHDAIRGDQVLTAGLEQLEHLKQHRRDALYDSAQRRRCVASGVGCGEYGNPSCGNRLQR